MLSQLIIIGLSFVRYPNAREVIPQIWLNIHNKMFGKCKKGLTKEHLDTIIGYYFSEWTIPEVQRRRGEARSGRIVSFYPAPFYTGRHRYKLCLRLYMDGDGNGKGTHLFFFFTLMRGEYDAQLKWPLIKYSSLFSLTRNSREETLFIFSSQIQPLPLSSNHIHISEMNVASGCPKFTPLSILDNPAYTKNDTMILRCKIFPVS